MQNRNREYGVLGDVLGSYTNRRRTSLYPSGFFWLYEIREIVNTPERGTE